MSFINDVCVLLQMHKIKIIYYSKFRNGESMHGTILVRKICTSVRHM